MQLTWPAMATLVLFASGASAADDPTFRIEFSDGVITPLELEVPANTRFRIELRQHAR